jgi:hypothetical protein
MAAMLARFGQMRRLELDPERLVLLAGGGRRSGYSL